MNLLVIDNSQNTARIALIQEGAISAYKEIKSKDKRGGKILKAIETILESKKLMSTDINCVGWVSGFGGFTSLRIAATIVNGFGYALDIPIVSVSWMDVLLKKAASPNTVIIWKNSRGDYFLSQAGSEPQVVDTIPKLQKESVVVSNDAAMADIHIDSLDTKELFLEAANILAAKAQQKRGGYKLSLPLYVRKPVG